MSSWSLLLRRVLGVDEGSRLATPIRLCGLAPLSRADLQGLTLLGLTNTLRGVESSSAALLEKPARDAKS